MLFALKKIAASFILPPGCFILLLSVLAVCPLKRRKRVILMLSVIFFFLLVSLPAVSGRLSSLVESPRSDLSALRSCDAIVLLGGGVSEGAKDLSGEGALTSEAACRTADAARLWRIIRRPVIACGGSVYGSSAEADIAARYLADLGVTAGMIIGERRSRDTAENARFAAEIMREKGFHKAALVTSSWHMRRASAEFRRVGVDVELFPSGGADITAGWRDFLPSAAALKESAAAMKEFAGIFASAAVR